MSSYSAFDPAQLPALSRLRPRFTDEPHEVNEQPQSELPQRQQLPPQQQVLPRPSSSSGSTRTLRRTPKFEERKPIRRRALSVESLHGHSPAGRPAEAKAQTPQPLSEEEDSSTTSHTSRRGSLESAFWPQRSRGISKHTASAILYALEEAIRKPFEFTPDLVEENASMSDLASGGPIPAGSGNGRARNGGSRAASASVPVPQESRSGVRTPTDIMRERGIREARKKAEDEARQAQIDSDQRRAREQARLSQEKRGATAGAAVDPGTGPESTSYRRSGTRRPGVEEPLSQAETSRRPGERVLSGAAPKANTPAGTQPANYGAAGTRSDNYTKPIDEVGESSGSQTLVPKRIRGSSLSQAQPKPVPAQSSERRTASASYNTPQQPAQARQVSLGGATNQAQAGASAAATNSQQPQPTQPASGTQSRAPNASSFPHAFERWETLSSHWEGLTGYWIRRLEANSDEMNREPLNQQLARQVTDLSAAGANLFHAVVELQRLRASSERKFQRWFYETRSEQERTQELYAGMDNTLRTERQARVDAVADLARMESDKNAAYQAKNIAEQMVKEMRRELQISKEEARRAWEELGRREQEERDRTTSLRNGEPTLVGGVQVVPMVQGAQSQQGSTNRPSTREEPYPSAPVGPTEPEGPIESPIETGGPGYATYDANRSETDTDPFTEGARVNPPPSLHHEPDVPSLPQITALPTHQQSSITSAAQVARAAVAIYSTAQPTTSYSAATTTATGGTYLRYGPTAIAQPPSSFYQHQGTALHSPTSPPPLPNITDPDARSIDALSSSASDGEEYALDSRGEIRYDAQGRPIPFRRPAGSEDSDEYDVQAQLERERMHGRTYGSGISGVEYGAGSTTTAGARPQTYAPGDAGGYGGWEGVARHHHPTRLSNVLEEDERSTNSPSRASERSRGLR